MGLYLFVSAVYGHMAEDTGLGPIPTESKSVVLPITPILNIRLGALLSGSRTRTGDCSRVGKVFKPSKLFWK